MYTKTYSHPTFGYLDHILNGALNMLETTFQHTILSEAELSACTTAQRIMSDKLQIIRSGTIEDPLNALVQTLLCELNHIYVGAICFTGLYVVLSNVITSLTVYSFSL